MIFSNICKATVSLTALALFCTAPALAHGPGKGGRGPSLPAPKPSVMKAKHPHARGLLAQLIYPCQTDCFEAGRTCHATADSEALSCITSACSAEVAAAQAACATSNTATECREAFAALQTCGESCLTARNTALAACRDALTSCKESCSAE